MQGTLELLVLKTLAASGPAHGFAILDFIRRATEEKLLVEEGALYPALHRMEQKGWLEAEWGITEKNRKAKYYRLTQAGRRQLTAELSRWSRYTEAVGLVITAEAAP